jgi:hypothetical protein
MLQVGERLRWTVRLRSAGKVASPVQERQKEMHPIKVEMVSVAQMVSSGQNGDADLLTGLHASHPTCAPLEWTTEKARSSTWSQ